MSLLFNRVMKKNPRQPDDPAKWFPVLKSRGLMSEREVALEISDETTLNPMEARMALYQFQKVVTKALLDGKTVRLGELGSFRLTLSATGADDKEAADHTKVKRVNMRFTPAIPLKEALAKAHLTKAVNLVSEL